MDYLHNFFTNHSFLHKYDFSENIYNIKTTSVLIVKYFAQEINISMNVF